MQLPTNLRQMQLPLSTFRPTPLLHWGEGRVRNRLISRARRLPGFVLGSVSGTEIGCALSATRSNGCRLVSSYVPLLLTRTKRSKSRWLRPIIQL